MSININAIFSSGVVDIDVLKTVLQEMASKIGTLEANQTVSIKFNEKINLTTAFNLITVGEYTGYYNITSSSVIKNSDSVIVFYDSIDSNGVLRTDVLSHTFIKNVNNSSIVINLPLEKNKIVNLYISYEK